MGDAVGVVAEEAALLGEVSGDGFYAEGADAVEVGFDGRLATEGVFFQQGGGDGRGIDERVVEDAGAGDGLARFLAGFRGRSILAKGGVMRTVGTMRGSFAALRMTILRTTPLRRAIRGCAIAVVEDFLDVLGGGEADGLVGLGHQVSDVDAGGARCGDGLWNASDEQVGDERGVEGAWAEGDEVCVGDGVEGCREGFGVGGFEDEFEDAVRAGGDAGLSVDERAIVHARGECDVCVGGWVDAPARGEDVRGHLDGLGEVSGDGGEGGEEEVAEAVAVEVAVLEAVLEEVGEEVLVFGERDHAVAHVSGGEHVEFFAEAAGGAAVVGDGDDGSEVADEAGKKGWLRAGSWSGARLGGGAGGVWRGDVALEAAQQRGQACAAADGDDAQGGFAVLRGRRHCRCQCKWEWAQGVCGPTVRLRDRGVP